MDKFEQLRDKSLQSALEILAACGLNITYEPARRSIYINYQECSTEYVFDTRELDPSIFIDVDVNEKILGVEILLPKEE